MEWLVEALELRPADRVLDLGCGPGLYCERFAARGFAVTGVDLSSTSIEHARRSAVLAGLEIDYLCADYRQLDAGTYDAAILVYLDLGVLSPSDRGTVLERVRNALRPGGRFAFDVVSAAAVRPEGTSWSASLEPGFWRSGPHLVLERRLDYPEQAVSGTEHTVLDEDGSASIYRVWEQRFSRDAVVRELADVGFETVRVTANLSGEPWRATSETLAFVARRL